MPKLSTLRTFMRRFKKTVETDHILKNCPLVIEGDSFFRQCYKDSGCNFMLGGECDRYADYLRKRLMIFIDSNVTCYMIFNGAMKMDVEKRKVIHKKLIDDRHTITPGDDTYFDPVFIKDVQRQVLEELGIRFCVIEYDARETLLDASKHLKCPILTSNIENGLLGMTCIIPGSLVYDTSKKQITCKIHTPDAYSQHIRIYDDMKPIFLTVLDENGPLFDKIPEILGSNPAIPAGPLLYWIKGQKLEPAMNKLASVLDSDAERNEFRDSVEELRKMILDCRQTSKALKYLEGDLSVLNNNSYDWFRSGVMTGKIASPYINLYYNRFVSGSWVIFDESKRDAMLPALDIVKYANDILGNSLENLNVTFIGRTTGSISVCLIDMELACDPFKKFVDTALPGFNWHLLETLPHESHLLLITLVYYTSKANKEFTMAAYSILLSCVMLGEVTKKVGLIKKSKIMSLGLGDREDHTIGTYKDCLNAANTMINYFYDDDIQDTFNRSLLHDLAEFQHCLQHMNYLNRLCGEKIPCTNYYKTYNGTFIFNVLIRLQEQDNPMNFLGSHFTAGSSVFNLYKKVVGIFDSLLIDS